MATLSAIDFGDKKFIDEGLEILGGGVPMETEQIFIPEFLNFGGDRVFFQGVLDLLKIAKEINVLIEVSGLITVIVS
jgi:hypothetical protein